MKVLLADALPDAAVERLEAAGDTVTRMPDLTADTLPDHIAGFEVLIVRSTRVTAATLDTADSLGLIVRARPVSSCATSRARTPSPSPS